MVLSIWGNDVQDWGHSYRYNFSHSLGRVASELASLRGGVRWGTWQKLNDISPQIPSPRWGSTLPEESEFLLSMLCRY